jgi:uncharacterized protein
VISADEALEGIAPQAEFRALHRLIPIVAGSESRAGHRTGARRVRVSSLLIARTLVAIAALAAPAAGQRAEPQPVSSRLARLVPPSPTPSFIADVPRLLAPDARERLDARIRAVQDSGFGDIAIAIMPSIGDYPAYEMGTAIYRSWGVGRIDSLGSERRDLGVLMLIVPKELSSDSSGHCWITTGLGAEGLITDATGGSICRDRIIPHLRTREYERAVAAGIEAIADEIRSKLTGTSAVSGLSGAATQAPRSRNTFPVGFVVAGLIALGGIGAAIPLWLRRRPRRCPRCGRSMRRLDEARDDAALTPGQQVEERIGSIDYDVWHCECGEDLVVPYQKMFSGYRVCDACKVRAVKTRRTVVQQPTYTSTGLADDVSRCESCDRTTTEQVILARRTPPSSGSSGGGGRGGGGGGGSFGGSGRTSGGGGGSRY